MTNEAFSIKFDEIIDWKDMNVIFMALEKIGYYIIYDESSFREWKVIKK